MAKFRKKPVVIEAITFEELVAHGRSVAQCVHNEMPWAFQYKGQPITHENDNCYLIPTLEGTMKFERGDMLITGVKGEIYPCKPDIFAATYEPADCVSTMQYEPVLYIRCMDHRAAPQINQAKNSQGECGECVRQQSFKDMRGLVTKALENTLPSDTGALALNTLLGVLDDCGIGTFGVADELEKAHNTIQGVVG